MFINILLKKINTRFAVNQHHEKHAYAWYKSFKRGRNIMGGIPRGGRPSTDSFKVSVTKVKRFLTGNPHSSL